MTKLGTVIAEAVIHDYGAEGFFARLNDPFWFQALGAVMGMDCIPRALRLRSWGALKRGLAPYCWFKTFKLSDRRGPNDLNGAQRLNDLDGLNFS